MALNLDDVEKEIKRLKFSIKFCETSLRHRLSVPVMKDAIRLLEAYLALYLDTNEIQKD